MSHCSWDLRGAIVHAFWRAVRGKFLEPKRLPVPMMIDGCWLYSYTQLYTHGASPYIPMQPLVKYLKWRFKARFTRCANLLPTSNIEQLPSVGHVACKWPPNAAELELGLLSKFFLGDPCSFLRSCTERIGKTHSLGSRSLSGRFGLFKHPSCCLVEKRARKIWRDIIYSSSVNLSNLYFQPQVINSSHSFALVTFGWNPHFMILYVWFV